MMIQYLFFLLFFLSLSAFAIPINQIDDQRKAQNLCTQRVVKSCVPRCEKANIKGCPSLCLDNAKNQCLEAGE